MTNRNDPNPTALTAMFSRLEAQIDHLNKQRGKLIVAIETAIRDIHYELPSVVHDGLKRALEEVS